MENKCQYCDLAAKNFREGYNCSQAVILTFLDKLGLDKDIALKISSSLGGGMGRLREVCGAVSAMFLVAGILKGYSEPNNDDIKSKHYELIQKLANEFKKEHKTIICRELLAINEEISNPKPTPRTQEFYDNRPCEEFIKTAAKIIEKNLLN